MTLQEKIQEGMLPKDWGENIIQAIIWGDSELKEKKVITPNL